MKGQESIPNDLPLVEQLPHGVMGLVKSETSWLRVLGTGAFFCALLAVAAALIWVTWNRSRRKAPRARLELLFDRLESIGKGEFVWTEALEAEQFLALSAIIRQVLSSMLGFPAEHLTVPELEVQLGRVLEHGSEPYLHLLQFFRDSEEVLYSGRVVGQTRFLHWQLTMLKSLQELRSRFSEPTNSQRPSRAEKTWLFGGKS